MEAAILSATAVSYQEQFPGKTDGKSSSPDTFSKLLPLFVNSTSASTGNPARTSGAEQGNKSDAPDYTAVQALLTAMQGLSGQSQSSLAGQLSTDTEASTGETGASSSADLGALSKLLDLTSGSSLSQALLEALGTGKDANAPAEAGGDSTGAASLLQKLLQVFGTDGKATPKDASQDLQTQSKELETAIPPGEGGAAAGNKPTAMLIKTTESSQSDTVSSTIAASPKTCPTSVEASQLLSPASLTQEQQSTSANGQLAQKTAEQAPLLQPAKVASDKSLQDTPQTARSNDGETLAFPVGSTPPQYDSSTTGAKISAAGITGDDVLGSKVISQIVDNAQLTLKGSNTSMSIQLKPEFLGDLKLVVEVEHGIVNAHFVAQNQTTANLIAARLPELRQALNDQGVSWQQLNVSCGGGQGNSQGASSQSQQQLSQPQMQFASGYDSSAGNDGSQASQAYQWTGAGALNCIV